MPLVPCLTPFGSSERQPGCPTTAVVEDSIYRPFSAKVFFDRDPHWGVYDRNGALIREASYRRGSNLELVGQSDVSAASQEFAQEILETCIYFGPLIPHYGHFIVSSLARAWFIHENGLDSAKLLCHSDFSPDEHFSRSFMGQIISGLDLKPENFIRPLKPTKLNKLIVPGPAFIEQRLVYDSFLPPMHRIGDTLLRHKSVVRQAKSAYFSKSRLKPPAVAKLNNEHIIDELMLDAGVDVYYPEQLSLAEQVEIFASYEKIIGFAGSAFHTHIFVRDPPEIICATYDPFINTNFIMLDDINQVAAQYFYPESNIVSVDLDGFAVSRSISDPNEFVRDLLSKAKISASPDINGHRFDQKETSMVNANCIPDHAGENYRDTILRLHRIVAPKSYLEIGTLTGGTLALSGAASIAIDPNFQVATQVIGNKPACLFYQIPSDDFFVRYDPKLLLGGSIDFAFLDGMHRCEYLLRDFINAERHSSADGVIVLHDCLPVEIPMTDRTQNGTPPVMEHRSGWWTGDVWRTAYLLKHKRPDLNIMCLDAAPTGLIVITNLDPYSTLIKNNYSEYVSEMMNLNLEEITISKFNEIMGIVSTATVSTDQLMMQAMGRS